MAISGAINGALSIAMFLAVVGTDGPLPIWNLRSLALDLWPQSFAIGLMAALIPGLLCRRTIRRGALRSRFGTGRWPAHEASGGKRRIGRWDRLVRGHFRVLDGWPDSNRVRPSNYLKSLVRRHLGSIRHLDNVVVARRDIGRHRSK
jgi:hypothetical protein